MSADRSTAQANNFHFVRLATASLVVVGHSFALVGQQVPNWLGTGIGVWAVRIFFVVSGYLVCESWNRDRSIHRYVVRRALRIFPALAMVVVLSALLLGPLMTERPLGAYMHDPEVRTYFWNILLAPYFVLPGVFLHNPFTNAVNGSLWTLPVEFVMYLILPLYGTAASPLCRRVVLPVALAVFGGAGFYYALHFSDMTPVLWWNSVPQILRWSLYFLAGAAVRIWMLQRFLNLHAAIAALALTALLSENDVLRNLLLIVVIPYVVLAFCLTPNPVLGRLARHSDISYGVYLYAFPIQQTLVAWFGPSLGPLGLMAAAMPLSWVCGFASWHAVEKRALTLKPRRPAAAASSAVAAVASTPNARTTR